jgi:hypothetical protein
MIIRAEIELKMIDGPIDLKISKVLKLMILLQIKPKMNNTIIFSTTMTFAINKGP